MPIHMTRNKHIATLTLDTPRTLNALDDELVTEAIEHLHALYESDDTVALILTGANGVFSAGGNLKMLQRLDTELQTNPDAAQDMAMDIRNSARLIEALRSSPIPTIAAINGACAGAAIGWVGSCDLRIASESAFFDTAYLKLGLGSDFGVSFLLHETVGAAIAKDWLLRPRRIPAPEAYTRGFVTEVVTDQSQLMTTAHEIAQFLGADRQSGVQAIRDNIAEAQQGIPLADHLAHEAQRFIDTLRHENTASKLEKIVTRQP